MFILPIVSLPWCYLCFKMQCSHWTNKGPKILAQPHVFSLFRDVYRAEIPCCVLDGYENPTTCACLTAILFCSVNSIPNIPLFYLGVGVESFIVNPGFYLAFLGSNNKLLVSKTHGLWLNESNCIHRHLWCGWVIVEAKQRKPRNQNHMKIW